MQPEIWVERPATAVDFYEKAFGARVLHRVGDGEDIVAQLALGRLGGGRHGAFQPRGDRRRDLPHPRDR